MLGIELSSAAYKTSASLALSTASQQLYPVLKCKFDDVSSYSSLGLILLFTLPAQGDLGPYPAKPEIKIKLGSGMALNLCIISSAFPFAVYPQIFSNDGGDDDDDK